jgi:hypothetical protein
MGAPKDVKPGVGTRVTELASAERVVLAALALTSPELPDDPLLRSGGGTSRAAPSPRTSLTSSQQDREHPNLPIERTLTFPWHDAFLGPLAVAHRLDRDEGICKFLVSTEQQNAVRSRQELSPLHSSHLSHVFAPSSVSMGMHFAFALAQPTQARLPCWTNFFTPILPLMVSAVRGQATFLSAHAICTTQLTTSSQPRSIDRSPNFKHNH